MIEWHSYHVPMGTDGLISEVICRIMAGKLGGIWFRPLSLGLDAWRGKEQKEGWGFNSDDEVFGMNFPDVPLTSEYCQVEDLKISVKNRVEALRGIGIKHLFLLNHHGGEGQIPALEELGKELTNNDMTVHGLKTYQFNDLTRLDPGELSVRETGILHGKPVIEEKWNPGNVSPLVANRLKLRVIRNFSTYISSVL